MSFTLTSGLDSVILPSPAIGNKYNINPGTVSKTSRAGKVLQFRNTANPVITTQVLTFTNVKQVILDELIAFLEDYRGKSITVTDHDSNSFSAMIQNDSLNYICDREDSCSNYYTFDLSIVYTYQAEELATEDLDALATEADEPLSTEAG